MYPVIANSLCARMDGGGVQEQGRKEKEVNNGGIFEGM